MLTLHDYLPSQNGWKVRTLLSLLNVSYRINPIAIFSGESRTDAFLRKNPAGAIPALELEDGQMIAESSAILVYLATGTDYLPSEQFLNAKVLQWLSFEQYYIEPTIGTLRFWTLTGRLERNPQAIIDSKREGGERGLAALERTLKSQPFLIGETFTIADLAVYAYAHLAEDAGFSFARSANVPRWIGRVSEIIGPDHTVHIYGDEARPA
jgi:glutathione S-transferase